MKALTVKAPWSHAIAHLSKDVENRVWSTNHRGLIAIHAGRGWDPEGAASPVMSTALENRGMRRPVRRDTPGMVFGAVVAVAELVDVCGASVEVPGSCRCGPWSAWGQHHWHLSKVRALAEPVPCKGALGLWTLPDDVEAAVAAKLDKAVTRG